MMLVVHTHPLPWSVSGAGMCTDTADSFPGSRSPSRVLNQSRWLSYLRKLALQSSLGCDGESGTSRRIFFPKSGSHTL